MSILSNWSLIYKYIYIYILNDINLYITYTLINDIK